MAKMLLYISVRDEIDITAECSRLKQFLQEQSVFAWAVLKALPEDPLRSAAVLCDLALVLALPKGSTFTAQNGHLAELLPRLLQNCAMEKSELAFAYHRRCKGQGVKPIQVHYRMHRRQDFLRADYLDYYVNHHSLFGMETPLIDYYQTYIDGEESRTFAEACGLQASRAMNVSEMHLEDMSAFLNSGAFEDIGPRAIADEERFVDRENSSMLSLLLQSCSKDYAATL